MKSILIPIALALFFMFVLVFSGPILKHTKALFVDITSTFKVGGLEPTGLRKQGGFVVLTRSYGGYQAGQTVELSPSTEAALIASGGGTTSAGPATPGPLTTFQIAGAGAFPAGVGSVIITNPTIQTQNVIYAVINQLGADATLTSIPRVVVANGSFTVFGNANSTGIVGFDWAVLNPSTTSLPT